MKPSADTPQARAALAYARQGWPVFPLAVRGKLPLIRESHGGHGHRDATKDVEQVAAWWDSEPKANIGFRPAGADVCVIDADGPLGFDSARARGLLGPPTLQCLTGRPDGGRHLYFRRPHFRVGNSKLAPK